ncbi:hypothetical protein OIU78_002945 [Salix suchowensis]|nr:hypothetical protein OIU78_002945 [Salix suchowensis]
MITSSHFVVIDYFVVAQFIGECDQVEMKTPLNMLFSSSSSTCFYCPYKSCIGRGDENRRCCGFIEEKAASFLEFWCRQAERWCRQGVKRGSPIFRDRARDSTRDRVAVFVRIWRLSGAG